MSASVGIEISKSVDLFDNLSLPADLILPKNPVGVVLISHGANSSRHSPRNRYIAHVLREHGFASLLIDLETPEEKLSENRTHEKVYESASRIVAATDWLRKEPLLKDLPIGYLASGSGAAPVFIAAAQRPNVIKAIVARGGRFEKIEEILPQVTAPILLIVGSRDIPLAHQNRDALEKFAATERKLAIIPGAHHHFEEPGTLSAAASHARAWFSGHLFESAAVPFAKGAVQLH